MERKQGLSEKSYNNSYNKKYEQNQSKNNSSTENKSLWCHYHENRTHNTQDCFYIKKLKQNERRRRDQQVLNIVMNEENTLTRKDDSNETFINKSQNNYFF
ncbi:hypothetical protein GVAV_002033 [Gurleya vavrai]